MTAVVLAAGIWKMTAASIGDKSSRKSELFWNLSVLSSAVITILVLIHVVRTILPIPLKIDRTVEEIVGWDQLGKKTFNLKTEMPRSDRTFVFAMRYQIASELAFYMPGQPETVSINRWDRPNVYDYWWRDEDLLGFDAIGVVAGKNARTRLQKIFDRVELPVRIPIYRDFDEKCAGRGVHAKIVKTYYVYKCYGFRGGLRWVPPRKDDVRNSG